MIHYTIATRDSVLQSTPTNLSKLRHGKRTVGPRQSLPIVTLMHSERRTIRPTQRFTVTPEAQKLCHWGSRAKAYLLQAHAVQHIKLSIAGSHRIEEMKVKRDGAKAL